MKTIQQRNREEKRRKFEENKKDEPIINRREFEKKKYEFIYGKKGRWKVKKYGGSNYAQKIYDLIKNLKIRSLCDVGCGKGDFCRWCANNKIKSTGIDIASKPEGSGVTLLNAYAQELPLEDKSFEFVTAFDMLEHLPPEDFYLTLDEFKRVSTRGMIFSLSYTRASNVFGENLHLIIQPKDWWAEQLSKYGFLKIVRKENKDFAFVFFEKEEHDAFLKLLKKMRYK